ncbi:hypothetical protein DPSP01_007990 [Paraphaeosphaeria sporulosa]|uniref:Uncharacterized protein n=1 Tax=Paraphaeosphaeria sporulosa TaxID=1460663 RepID=A0A177CFI2_9PLEO|nr:uncharacterized protein CC84DRAFT_1216929 [Paraphaeosphaeria sporulosa]OAG05599.1 hypothetical protein CC84DRAFT_1216929 [Paraphaeosphaeria sporulosa]
MPINWQDPEVKDRILASIIASFGTPINCREVARIFGPEATYDAIENFLRKPKKKAKELITEAAARGNSAPARGANSPAKQRAPRTPKKSDGVKTGRVTKSTPKKNVGSPVKKEMLEGDEAFNGGAVSTPQGDYEMDEDFDAEI